MPRMKALVCNEHGPPESLVYQDMDPPDCGKVGVRIDVRAAGVNFPDVLIIQNQYQLKPPLPFSPGGEVAGVVSEVGAGVTNFKVGDRVIGITAWGGFSEQVVVPEDKCFHLPETMGYDVGSSFSLTYGTSYYALVQRAQIQPGETLLVHGASGGVGLAAVEIGKALGAKIIATGGNDDKLAVLREKYGVEHTINYREDTKWKDTVKRMTGGRGADVIYDPVGGEVFEQSLRCINWYGRLLVIGFASGKIPAAKANYILLKSCSVVGVYWGSFTGRDPKTNAENFVELFKMHADGKLKPNISHRFPLDRGAEALQALVDRKVVGKAVLEISTD